MLPAWALAALLVPAPAPSHVSISLATLHAAALTTARGSTDQADAPYFLVSVVGPRVSSSARLPAGARFGIVNNGIVQPTELQRLELAPGDSVRVVISVLEAESGELAPETDAAKAATLALSGLPRPLLDPAGPALGPTVAGLRAPAPTGSAPCRSCSPTRGGARTGAGWNAPRTARCCRGSRAPPGPPSRGR
ncbi:MAG: hypothetical protein IPG75_09630 [Gemmatimonadetes bacterium]|nr:hypothetical protein [Gemmatimonadota bacterium]